MSWKDVPTLVCDGCGQIIDMDYYIHITPVNQQLLQENMAVSPERHFCCEACKEWWHAQYPEDGPWGAAWDEHEWWQQQLQASGHVPVRTTHGEMPLIDTHTHFGDPEPVK